MGLGGGVGGAGAAATMGLAGEGGAEMLGTMVLEMGAVSAEGAGVFMACRVSLPDASKDPVSSGDDYIDEQDD
ncbi:hypothetical protein C0995_010653, partial [Termitomyces sp. Mi166